MYIYIYVLSKLTPQPPSEDERLFAVKAEEESARWRVSRPKPFGAVPCRLEAAGRGVSTRGLSLDRARCLVRAARSLIPAH